MANNLKDSLIEAMEIMLDNDSQITYDCTVIKCLDGVTGEYELDYMSNTITAFSLDSSKKYAPNDLVMVIAPKGDFNGVKYILGLTNPKKSEGAAPAPEDTFVVLTDDLLEKDNPEVDVFGLKSYYSTDYTNKVSYYEEDITDRVCYISRFKERIVKYLTGKETVYLRFKITIKTDLSQEQIFSSGFYGIKLSLPFINKGYIDFDFNSNSMEGSPKSFLSWTLQTLDIKINQGLVYNSTLPPIVKIYKNNFLVNEELADKVDIQIRNVELYAMKVFTPENLEGYKVFISATGGDYFLQSDTIHETKTLTATLKSNGVDTDISKDDMYWFVEDATINEESREYFEIGGPGWKCLNPYTIENEGTSAEKVNFESRLEKIKVMAMDIVGSKKYKCLIKHNGNYFNGETTIYNETDTFYLTLTPTGGEIISIYEDEVELKLKFYYQGITEKLDNVKKICYNWSKIDNDGLEDLYFVDKYLQVVKKNELVEENGKVYWVTTAKFPVSIIEEVATVRCSVHLEGELPDVDGFEEDKKHFIGTAETILTMAEEYTDPYLEDMKKAIPIVLSYYNTGLVTVGQEPDTIASISCRLLRKTNLQGHLVVKFNASEYCNVILQFLDSGMKELFAPVTFTANPGSNTIGVPHAYLDRLEGIHSFTVVMQCTNGTINIPVRGILFTIDGGYIIERLISAGMEVEDITIKQTDMDTSPSEIWAVGFDHEGLVLKKRDYNPKVTEDWVGIKNFGPGISAAVEFRGFWIIKNGFYTLQTEDFPFVFMSDEDKILKVYYGKNYETVFELDTDVTQVSACQGFNSLIEEEDSGMIAAYIKNGNVYYRQYLYDKDKQIYMWYSALPIYMNGDAIFVTVHRLPDYRIGICIKHAEGVKWLITERNYIGQAVKPEKVNIESSNFAIITMYDKDKAPATPSVQVATKNILPEDTLYHNNFVLSFDGPIAFVDGKTNDILINSIKVSIDGVVLSKKEIKNITIEKNNILVSLVKDVMGGKTVQISLNCPYTAIKIYNGSLAPVEQNYSWLLPLPTYRYYETEVVNSTLSANANIVVRPIITTKINNTEEKSSVAINPIVNVMVKPIITNNFKIEKEKINLTMNTEISVVVLQVGVTPV